MRRSSRKIFIVGALTLAALAGPVAVANAAGSLTLAPATNTFVSQSNTVAASGTASGNSFIYAYAQPFAADCEANASAESIREDVVAIGNGGDAIASGAFSINLAWTPILAVSHVICGYLYDAGQDPGQTPLGATSVPVTIVVKPANTDNDGDGVPNDVDKCPDLAGTGADGCPPPVTPVTPVTPTVPGGIPTKPVANAPATNFDPTGVLKLKSSKGKATSCGAGCLIRTRTVGPFSFVLKVKVSGSKTKGTGSVTLTRKSAQAGKAGQVCLGRYTAKTGQVCKKVAWAVGKKITVSGSITTPSAIGKSARPGFGVTAHVGQVFVGSGASVYLKSAGGKVKPDTNESACAASAGAHAAC